MKAGRRAGRRAPGGRVGGWAGGQAGRQAEDPTASLSAFGTVRAQGYLLFYDSVEADETSSEPEPEPEPEG